MRKRPRLLILDDYEGQVAVAPAMARLRALAEVTVRDRPLASDERDDLAAMQVLMTLRERTRLDEPFFARCPQLELVLQTGGHAYHLDEPAATARGIVVALGRRAQQPTIAVAELTIGLILTLARQMSLLTAQLAQGGWPQAVGWALAGRTLGILGLGRHGRPVARLAAAFGMRVLAWDRGQAAQKTEPGVPRLPLDDLLAQSDVVSIHLRLSPESQGLFDRARLARMRSGALLINTARGAIVQEDALIDALRSGHLGGAGLDVFETEPLPAASPLRTLPNVVRTPHIGWKVTEVFQEFAAIAADQLAAWLDHRLAPGEVLNPAAIRLPRERLGGLIPVACDT